MAVIARPDEDQGEHLIVVTNEAKTDGSVLRQAIQGRGPDRPVPCARKVLPESPRLGTGKVDHRQLERMV